MEENLDDEYNEWLEKFYGGVPEDQEEPPMPEGMVDHDEEDRVAFEMEKVRIRAHRPSEY